MSPKVEQNVAKVLEQLEKARQLRYIERLKMPNYTLSCETWPGLAKLVEEMGELHTILGKIMSNGGKTDYYGDVDLNVNLHEELGDVMAAMAFFVDHNDVNTDAIVARADEKQTKYKEWRENKQ